MQAKPIQNVHDLDQEPLILLGFPAEPAARLDGNVTLHTLSHTAATWLMQLGTDPWQAVKVMIDTYGHHHSDYMKEASGAITRKRETPKRVVGTREAAKPTIRTRSIRAIRP